MSVTSEKISLPPPRHSRLAFLKTKKAFGLLTGLVIVAVVLIGATGTLTPDHSVARHQDSSYSSNTNTDSGNGNVNNSTNPVTDDDGISNGGENDGKDGGKDDGKGDGGDSGNGKSGGTTTPPLNWKPANSSTIADGTPLRIMCLGASIVRGERSTDQNGFRKTLREDLTSLGATVNMVGTQRYGNMLDNDFEAYGGNRVSQIYKHARDIVPELLPNVFVINVGTNNALQRKELDIAGEQMGEFIDYLLKASPSSTVVLSTLLTNTVPEREPMILDMNEQFRSLYSSKFTQKPVVLAELHPSEGLPGRPQTEDIGPDGSHPTDHGYEIMGHLLAEAIKDADSKGYLRVPEDNGLEEDGDQDRGDGVELTTELPPKPTKAARKPIADPLPTAA
ncbi:SGNH hydrolase-type esterase domain-containing protein [Poronia punctata]|nr:SGNH hydrolase-type esterase domain-containing protein [Poronia punctata]